MFTRLDDIYEPDFKQQTRLESHNPITVSGLNVCTAATSSTVLKQTSGWFQLNQFLGSVLSLFTLENNLSNLVLVKTTITISLIRCKTLLQSSL